MAPEVVKSGVILRFLHHHGAAWIVVMAVAFGGWGCQTETPTAPSPGSLSPPLVIETFSGTLGVGGSAFYSFNVPVEGPVSFTLIRYRENGEDTTKVVNMGIGIPAGTTCVVASSVTTKAGNSPQFSQTVPQSIYCVRVTDPGQLEASADFLINIAHPK